MSIREMFNALIDAPILLYFGYACLAFFGLVLLGMLGCALDNSPGATRRRERERAARLLRANRDSDRVYEEY